MARSLADARLNRFAVVAAVLLATLLIAGCPAKPSADEKAPGTSSGLSQDQRDLVSELGHPDGFTVAFVGKSRKREEAWSYYGVGTSFLFVNGEYQRSVSDLEALPEGVTRSKVKPESFRESEGRSAIDRRLGEPVVEGRISEKLTPGTSMARYAGGVTVGVKDGKVIWVQAAPYRLREIPR